MYVLCSMLQLDTVYPTRLLEFSTFIYFIYINVSAFLFLINFPYIDS